MCIAGRRIGYNPRIWSSKIHYVRHIVVHSHVKIPNERAYSLHDASLQMQMVHYQWAMVLDRQLQSLNVR